MGLSYSANSREAFARAHPELCGQAYDVMLRGYERWLIRQSVPDQIESFASYLSNRFNRALLAD
jgi:hypothetical protein